MKICLIEPFFTGSHANWANEYVNHSRHDIDLFTLKGRHWKWRMHGGAVSLAEMFLESDSSPDLLLATDMLDLTTFLALTRHRTSAVKAATYFHENQLTYPWSPTDPDSQNGRKAHFAFINYSSALAADVVLFNSDYHRRSFLDHLPGFLNELPDHRNIENVERIRNKSSTLPLGLDLMKMDGICGEETSDRAASPTILWNHRWEYDKNPEDFFRAMFVLKEEGYSFNLVILGESFRRYPAIFDEAAEKLKSEILHIGYVDTFEDYARWLWQADILPVTSLHDFFGASVVQAIYCQCAPLLPDRLAYPEHIPQALQPHYLYNRFDDLLAKLRETLQQPISANRELSRHVASYDWIQMVERYDHFFENLV